MDTYNGGIPSTEEFLRLFVHTLASAPGLLAILGFLLLTFAAASSKKARWVAFAGVVYLGTFGFTWTPWFKHILIPPLQIIEQQSRNLTVALMLVVCVGAFFSPRGNRQKLLIAATVAVLLFELLYCGRLMFGGWFTKGVFGVLLYFLIFGTFAIGLPLLLQDLGDVHTAIRCLAVAGLLFCLGTSVQLLLDRNGIVSNGRLASTPGTATQTAEAIAVVLPAVVFLLLSKSEPRLLRAVWLATAGALVIFLVYTGTRNGVLMAFVAMTLLFRFRLGKLVLAVALVGIVGAVVWHFFGSDDARVSASRLLMVTDTRSEGWKNTWAGFVANPAFGSLNSHGLLTENSYITVAGYMGLFGLIPLAIVMTMVGWAVFKLNGLRKLLGEDAMLADLVIAGIVSVAIGAVFEGYLLGMLNLEIYAVYIYLAILTFIFDKMRQVMQAGQLEEQYDPAYTQENAQPVYDMAGAGYS